jgi:hypothetical protein
MNWAKLALALLVLAAGHHGARARERTVIDFRSGIPAQPAMKLYGYDAASVTRTDEHGLRFSLPAGRKDVNSVGLEIPFRIQGDFEISLGYELLAVGDPIPEAGAGVQFMIHFDSAIPVKAAITRLRKANPKPARLYEHVINNGDTFGAARLDEQPDGKDKLNVWNVRAEQPTGRLKLTRIGSRLQYWVADGDRPYHQVRELDIGTDDVKRLQPFCFAGYRPVMVDVRISDITIEADMADASSAPSANDFVADAEASASSRTNLLVLGTLFLGGMVAVLGVFLLWLLLGNRRRRASSARTDGRFAPTSVSFPCSCCGKKLKTTPDLAGKMAKCPNCNQAMLVPDIGSSVAGL